MAEKSRKAILYGVHTVFRLCQGAQTLESVKPLAHLLAQEGFHPSSTVETGTLTRASDINALVEAHCEELRPDVADYGGLLRSTGFPLYVDSLPAERVWCAFQWQVFQDAYVQVTLSGGVYALPTERTQYQTPFAEMLLALALKLYPLVKPAYGFVADPDIDAHPWEHDLAVKRKIATLSWVNFFGPAYVEKYGRAMLSGIPGFEVQDLSDGGLLYQSRPSIVVRNEIAHKRWQQEAADYLAHHGVRIRFNYPRD